MSTNRAAIVSAFAAGTLLLSPLLAVEETYQDSSDSVQQTPAAEPSWQLLLHSSYTAPSTAKFNGINSAKDSDAYAFDLSIGHKITLNTSWSLLFELTSENIYLNAVPSAPIPDGIHTFRLTTGIEYKLSEKWTVTGLFGPSLYRLEDVDINDVGLFGGLLTAYRYNATLTLSLGLIVSPNSSLSPVLPVGGLDWKINQKLELQLMFPKPRLLYQVIPKWTVFAGADVTGATFRTTKDFGMDSGFRRYGNALADYRDIRAGIGTGYQINRGIRLEVEGGFSVYRQLDYIDLNKTVKFDPSPYVTISLKSYF
jgi:hypothetical protein